MFNPSELQTYILSRRDVLLQEGDHSRLIAEAAKLETGQPLYAPALAQMGTLLVEIGSKLRNRYGEMQADVTLVPCPDSQFTGTP